MGNPPRARGSIRIGNVSSGGRIDIRGDSVEVHCVSAGGDLHVEARLSPADPEPAPSLARPAFFDSGMWRDADRKTFLGVASGIAWKIDVDPFWIRIGFVAGFMLSFGIATLVYLGFAIAMKPRSRSELPPADAVPPELVEAWREVNEITRHE